MRRRKPEPLANSSTTPSTAVSSSRSPSRPSRPSRALAAVATPAAARCAAPDAPPPRRRRPSALTRSLLGLRLDLLRLDLGLGLFLLLGLGLVVLAVRDGLVGGLAAPAAAAAAARAGLGLGGDLVDGLLGDRLGVVAALVGDDPVDEVGLAQTAEAVEAELRGDRVQIGEGARLQGGAGQHGHEASSYVASVSVGIRFRVVAAAGDPVRRAEASGPGRRDAVRPASSAAPGSTSAPRRRCRTQAPRRRRASTLLTAQEVGRLGDVVDADDRGARRRAAQPTAASVPARRPAGWRPVIAPTKYLRDTASRSGRPSAATRSIARSTATVSPASWRSRAPDRGPAGRRRRRRSRGGAALGEERDDVGDHVAAVVGEALLLRRGARVHDDERGARRRARLGEAEVLAGRSCR